MSLREVRLRQALFAMVLGGALAVTGCATTGPKDAGNGPAEAAAQAAPEAGKEARISVEYINVVGEGDRVLFGTTGVVKYTVFKLSDPDRLIVDMPGVDLSKVTSPISVGNDYLGDITAVTYGEDKEIGRVIIGLKPGVDHEVKSSDKSLLVSLAKAAPADEAGSVVKAAQSEVVEEAAPAEETVVESAPAPEAKEEKAAEAKAAAKVLGVASERKGDNTVVRISTDGRAGYFTSFELANPSRIVVDVWGVGNSAGKDAFKLKDKYFKGVRIGSYQEKTRLVFDSPVKKLPPHSIDSEDGALVLTVGPKVVPSASAKTPPPVQTAQKAASAPAREQNEAPAQVPVKEAPAPAAAAPEAAPAEAKPAQEAARPEIRVTGVDYKKVGGKGRLVVSSSEKAEYRIKEGNDGKTVVLDLQGATIPDNFVRTLDASRLGTSVATISSYQDSVSPKSVRVLVKLKDKAAYNVQEDGASVIVDFAQAETPAATAEPKAAEGAAVKDKGIEVATDKEYNGKKIDLDMMDANVSDVLRLLAEISNLNIIASDDVKGTISLRLKNVPWDQAFDIILKAKDLDSIREGNVIRVAPAMKIRQEKESSLASRKAQEKLEELEIEFIPVNYATAEDLAKQVKGVLSERGDVTTDKRTNTLIVRDIKSGISEARNLIAKLDTQIPQVLIEARIVEAESSFTRDLGIQWGVDFQSGGNVSTTTFGASGTKGQTFTAPSTTPTFTDKTGTQNYAVNLPVTSPAGGLGFILGKAGVNPLVLDLRLTAGETQGKLKTISRPRITTMDNKEAKIEQGESIPFETTSASGTSTTFIDANLSLTVTPHITPDGSVLMKIKASRNSIGTFRTSDGKPSINKKESMTDVLVKDGETTVIGGIVITDNDHTERGIPVLKDIPVLGWLFKSKSVTDKQTELLIFITPKIIKDKVVG